MGNVSAAIQKYITNHIRLSREDISGTVASREWFLNRIASVIENRYAEPVLYGDERFVYFGSYFKGTKVATIDEYDVLVVIDSNNGRLYQSGSTIGVGLGKADPNHKYDPIFYKEDGSGVSPTKLLNWLKGVVREVTDAFGGDAPIRNGQAVTATIKSRDLKIDLVPAGIFKHVQTGEIFYNIPRGDIDNGWILTNPKQDKALLDYVASGKQNFKNVIRIAKRIRDTYRMQVSSFAIETAMVLYAVEDYWVNNLYIDTRIGLSHLAGCFRSGNIADSYDTSKNLLEGVENLDWYAQRLDAIVEVLNNCFQNETDQDKVYERIFNAFENQ